jgi:hypothetical protein
MAQDGPDIKLNRKGKVCNLQLTEGQAAKLIDFLMMRERALDRKFPEISNPNCKIQYSRLQELQANCAASQSRLRNRRNHPTRVILQALFRCRAPTDETEIL